MSESASTLGERLKTERERRGLSTQKVADEMHLDAWVIDALEAGDYQRIGPPVYAKGHLKKYASILGLSPAVIASGYATKSAAPAAVAPPSVVMRMPRAAPAPVAAPWPQIVTVALVVVAVAAVAWWRPWQHGPARPRPAARSTSPGGAASPSAPPVETAANAAPPSEPPSDGASNIDASTNGASSAAAAPFGAATTAAAPGATPSAEYTAPHTPATKNAEGGLGSLATARAPTVLNSSAPAPTSAAEGAASAAESLPGAGRARLRLSFSADSWVDVRDATGRRVFAGNGRANSVQTIAGMAPLTVYLGFASGVQLEVNDHVVAIGPQFVSGDVARFVAGADGVLRRDTHPVPGQGAQTHTASPRG